MQIKSEKVFFECAESKLCIYKSMLNYITFCKKPLRKTINRLK